MVDILEGMSEMSKMNNRDRLMVFLFGFVIALAVVFLFSVSIMIPDEYWDLYNFETIPSSVVWDYIFTPFGGVMLQISFIVGLMFLVYVENLAD